MSVIIREYTEADIPAMLDIWNEVVENGKAFPQTESLNMDTGKDFFSSQSFTAVAEDNGSILGLYILHPNNIGRCAHIANASYAVSSTSRGKGLGQALVIHSLDKAKDHGFGIMQFNAVVKSNHNAIKLYKKLGFVQLGVIPKGFKLKDGSFEDILPFYYEL